MKVLRLFLQQASGSTWAALALSGLGGLLSGAAVLKLQTLLAADRVTFADAGIVAALGLSQIACSIGARLVFAPGLYTKVLAHLRLSVTRAVAASSLRAQETCGTPRVWGAIDAHAINVALAGNSFVMASRSVTTGIACFVALALTAPRLLPHAIGAVVLGLALFALVSRRAASAAEESQVLQEELDVQVAGLTAGNRELRQNATRRYAFMTHGLSAAIHAFQAKGAASSTWNVAASRMIGVPIMALVGAVLFFSPSLAQFRSSVVTLLFLQAELAAVLAYVDMMRQGELSLGRIYGVLDALRTTESRGNVPADASKREWSTLTLENVTATYPSDDGSRQFTLGPVDVTLKPGEVVFIIGGNGSGKSTLSKVITGLYAPDGGKVLVDGKEITDEDREAYRQLFTAIFANHHVYRRLYGLDAPDLDERGKALLESLELGGKVEVKNGTYSTTQLSSGQRKRLSMVTARLEDRRIMVFDEWASDQDPHFRDLFYRKLLPELKAEGRAILVVSHDDRYFDAADRILRLEDGRIVHDGRPPMRTPTVPPQAVASSSVAS